MKTRPGQSSKCVSLPMRNTQKTSTDPIDYLYIDSPDLLRQFANDNQSVSWMGFDTEFIGEKRYYTLLCLVQIITEHGIYIIDALALEDLTIFYDMIADPNIIKITHAGENDYRLVNTNGGVQPRNLFDTQIAAGFVGYSYPISFRKLVENELDIRLGKGYTVSDWESRPINEKQMKYALNDIIYLKELWDLLSERLRRFGRHDWAIEEMRKYESPDYYVAPPHKEAFSNNLIVNLRPKNQLFLIRLYEWRRQQAERKNYSKEMILPAKFIGPIARHISSNQSALINHRRIPKGIIDKHVNHFIKLYEQPASAEEKDWLKKIPTLQNKPSGQETIMEMLQLLMKIKCNQEQLSHSLLTNGTGIKKMKADAKYFDEKLASGWRAIFLGDDLLHWLRNRKDLEIDMQKEQCIIRMKG